jgi:accessory gene regulator protein AgrB
VRVYLSRLVSCLRIYLAYLFKRPYLCGIHLCSSCQFAHRIFGSVNTYTSQNIGANSTPVCVHLRSITDNTAFVETERQSSHALSAAVLRLDRTAAKSAC